MIGIVPARGGSKGLRHKNLLTIDGIPLVINAAHALREYCKEVLVCTEDAQIASVARLHGYEVLARPAELAEDDVSVDDLMKWVLDQDRISYPVVMHQPTVYSPQLAYLEEFIIAGRARNGNYVLGVREPHLVWTQNTSPERRQRQDAGLRFPAQEYGVRFYNRPDVGFEMITRQVSPIFDIDTPYDLDAARRAGMRKGRVMMRYAESTEIGSGHRRRLEAIADEIQHLDVHMESWGAKTDYFSVIVNDTLDTTDHAMLNLKRTGAMVVTLEDLGPGIRHADVVINALYDKSHARYAVLRPEFRNLPKPEIKDNIENILVTFGGTDPSHYTEIITREFRFPVAQMRVIAPPGRSIPEFSSEKVTTVTNANMAEEMRNADLVITSAGRTIFEAAVVGTPVLCVAHNLREARHAHLGPASGNIFMGIGLDLGVLSRNVRLLQDPRLRAEMSEAGRNLTDGRGAERIARIVEDLL